MEDRAYFFFPRPATLEVLDVPISFRMTLDRDSNEIVY